MTLDGHKPSLESIGATLTMQDIILIDYTSTIQTWLSECVKECEEIANDSLLSKIIGQYDALVKKITSNLAVAKENKAKIAEKIEEAWKLQTDNFFFTETHIDLYKHIKWHTIADFYDRLEASLNETHIFKVCCRPTLEEITKVAHNKNENSTTRLVLSFVYNEEFYYLANDNKGFTIGVVNQNRWDKIEDKKIGNIIFQKFSSNQNTFSLIDEEKLQKTVTTIVNTIIPATINRLNNYIKSK